MQLPFLKNKHISGSIMTTKVRTPDRPDEKAEDKQEDNHDAGLLAASADLIRGIQADDQKAVASALKAAFMILDSMPHDEGEHTNEDEGQE